MNKRLYYLYKLMQHIAPIYPIYLILFESKGLSASQISLLLAIWSFSVVLFEVPTGILSDYWNRRNMLIIGSICKVMCYIIWLFSEGFMLFALGFALWGLSEAFCSGSEEALVYDNLKLQGKENEFDEVYGKGQFYYNIGVAISGISGGFLSMACGMRFVLIVSIISMLVCVVVSTRFKEANFFVTENQVKSGVLFVHSFATLRDSIIFCTKSSKLLLIIIISVFVIGMDGILDEYDPLVAKNYGLNLGFIGIWVCLRNVMEAFGARVAHKFKLILLKLKIKDPFIAIWTICLSAGAFLGIAGWIHSIILIPLYGLFYLLMSSARVLHEDFVQHQINEQGRSTVHSLISLMYNLYAISFFGMFSIVLSKIDIHRVLVIMSVHLIIICFILRILYGRIREGTP